MATTRHDRRALLRVGLATLGAAASAGCLGILGGGDGEPTATTDEERPTTATPTATATPTPTATDTTGGGEGSIAVGGSVEDTLERGDGQEPAGARLAEPVDLAVDAETTVRVTMRSDAFDPLVVVATPDGEVLTSIDDGGGERDSQGVVSLPSAGRYVLWASSFSGGGTGAYTLAVERVTESEDETELRSIRLGETAEGYVGVADGRDPLWSGIAEPVEVAVEAGTTVQVRMESEAFDPYVVVEGPNGGVVGSYSALGEAAAEGTFTAEFGGTHVLWASSFSETATGAYTLRVERAE